jgi:hypothetical protein
MNADYDVKLQLGIDTVGSEVLTAVIVKSSIYFDITPCSPLKVNHTLKHPVRKIPQSTRYMNTKTCVTLGRCPVRISARTPAIFTGVFCGFTQPFRENSVIENRFSHYSFLLKASFSNLRRIKTKFYWTGQRRHFIIALTNFLIIERLDISATLLNVRKRTSHLFHYLATKLRRNLDLNYVFFLCLALLFPRF